MTSQRLKKVQQPVIPDVAALIRQYSDTISLGQGMVHYAPPPSSMEILSEFGAQESVHKYQGVNGDPQLIEALREKLAAENGIVVDRDRFIMVTAGSNMAFVHCVLALCDPGDEIIMMTPYYFNHEMAATMANVRPVLVPTTADHQPRPERIAAAISPRTRAVVTISPNNPTGAVYTEAALRQINALCHQHGLYHICDEAYEYFTYDDAHHFSPGSIGGSAAHTISLFSFSKAYGMASWRVGYAVVPAHLRDAMAKIQDTILICPPAICQQVALAALQVGRSYCRAYIESIDQVRRLCLDRLASLRPRCHVPRSCGAFYLLAEVESPLPAMELVQHLVRDYGVAVIPGNAFGITDRCCLRIAYGALTETTVAEGLDRLVAGLDALMPSRNGGCLA